MVKALSYYKDISQYNMPGAVASGDSFKSYPSGSAAITVLASYLINYIESSNPEVGPETGSVYKVKEDRQSSYASLGALVPVQGMSEKQAQVSKEWMKWLMTGKRRTDFLHVVPGGFNPVRKSVLYSKEYLAPETYEKWGPQTFINIVEGTSESTLFGWFPDGTVIPEIGDVAKSQVVQGAIYDLTQKNRDPEKVADQLEKDVNEVLGY